MTDMIEINNKLAIDDDEISLNFIRAGGPGGQNVNKVATAVQLRFDVRHSPSLGEDVKSRLTVLAGRRLNKNGVLVLAASGYRTQEANRRDVLTRFVALIDEATHRQKPRVATRPGKGAVKRRLERKAQRGGVKRLRSRRIDTDG